MSYPHRPSSGRAASPVSRVDSGRWTVRRPGQPLPQERPNRRYEATALVPGEGIVEINRAAPVHPIFDAAVSALARGTLLATPDGPVAVEDLMPGMEVETRDDGFQPVLWIGTTMLLPQAPAGMPPARLFRIPAESFGPSRPMPDLVLAPHARILHRSPRFAGISPDGSALMRVGVLEDGFNVLRVAPASPVRVYHLAFAEHHILRANGIEIESFHPGEDLMQRLSGETLRLFLSLFPHMKTPASFGRLRARRLSAEEFETLTAA